MSADIRIPELEHRPPDCPLCGEETTFEDTLCCPDCEIHWPDDRGPGERNDPETPICGAEVQPWADHATIGDHRFRCLRPEGHSTKKHAGVRVDKPGRSDHTYLWKV